jgi:hypothetical protein
MVGFVNGTGAVFSWQEEAIVAKSSTRFHFLYSTMGWRSSGKDQESQRFEFVTDSIFMPKEPFWRQQSEIDMKLRISHSELETPNDLLLVHY